MSFEAKCNCQHCNQHIAFTTEQAGQTVACPNCRMDTRLFIPPSQNPKPEKPKIVMPEQKHQQLIEDDLQSIGSIVFALGIAGGFFSFLAMGFCIVNVYVGYSYGQAAVWMFVAMFVSVAQGWIIRSLFRALAEIIRLLRRITPP